MFRSMNSWPNFTSQNVKKHHKVIYPRPDIFILILFSALFHPHFVIRIFSSAFFHPPSAIRRHPVRTLQRPVKERKKEEIKEFLLRIFKRLNLERKKE